MIKQDIDFYIENGYLIKKILTEEQCDEINKYIDNNNKNAYYEKNNNEKFGYKFDKDENSPVKDYIEKNTYIDDIGKQILGAYDFSVIKSFYKSAFMARDIEYHQEYQYNAHHPTRNNWKDYIQIFTALEEHTLENACLKIIPKSHKDGLLPYTDIINSNLEHKRSVEYNTLKDVYKKYGILNCTLKKGEAIFFNHLIIHGSQNNNSPFSRHALVCTIYLKGLQINNQEYEKFEKFRKEFTINELEKKQIILINKK